MSAIAETFGPMFPLFLLLTTLYFLASLAPLTWPAWRAFRLRLPRRWLFCAVVASLVYGAPVLVVTVVLVPAGLFDVYLAPQLVEFGEAWAGTFASASAPLVKHWWLGLPAVLLGLTFGWTRWLGRRWRAICDALTVGPAETR